MITTRKNDAGFLSSGVLTNLTRRTIIALMGGSIALAHAQPTGLLYDPEPPADSGYVRVMSLADAPKVSVMVNGQSRIPTLLKQQPSEYMVIPAGRHQLATIAGGKVQASVALDVVSATAITVVFSAAATPPLIFTDKTGTNKLKSMLTVYQLLGKNDTVDLTTADGATKIFSGLAYGKSGALQVNPISVDLMAVATGSTTPLARTSLRLNQGSAYSIFLLPGPDRKAIALATENKIERYTGK